MKTKIYEQNEVHLVANAAKEGQIIAFPTETVYGLGVVFDDVRAFNELIKVKNRDEGKPFTLMVAYTRDLGRYAQISNKAASIIECFLPGELTLILPVKKGLPEHVTRGSDFIGLRVSANYQVSNLINLVGKPLLVPSANISGEKPAVSAEEVYNIFKCKISAILNGVTTSHIPSTIIKISDKIELVRAGSIPFENILKVWEETL